MKRLWKRVLAVLLAVVVFIVQVPDFRFFVYAAMDPTESLESYVAFDQENLNLLATDANSLYRSGGRLSDEYAIMPLVAGVDDAFLAICKIVFAACGVVVNGDNLRNLSNQFYNWLQARSEEWSDSFRAANMVKDLTIGASIAGVAHLIKAAKAFLNSITGYGTAAKSYTVPAVITGQSYFPNETSSLYGAHYVCSFKSSISMDGGDYVLWDVFIKKGIPISIYFDGPAGVTPLALLGVTDDSPITCGLSFAKTQYKGFVKSGNVSIVSSISASAKFAFASNCTVPIFTSLYAASYYAISGTVRDVAEWLNPTANIEIATPVVDAQTSDVTVVGDPSIVIPDLALLEQLLSNVATKEDIKAALKDIVALDYAGDVVIPTDVPVPSESASEEEDTTDPYLPWVPDITGRLDGILDGLKGLGDKILDIPDSIAGKFSDVVSGVQVAIQDLTNVLNPPAEDRTLPEVVMTRFPFCIPFDLVSCFQQFDSAVIEPRWEIPLNIPSIGLSYTFVLDLTQFTDLVALVRVFVLLGYIVSLILLTRGLIKG